MPMSQRFVREGQLDLASLTAELRRFLDLLLKQTGLELQYEVVQAKTSQAEAESPQISVTFHGPDQDILLQRNAELLLALEYLALRWLRIEPGFHDQIRFDSGDYRALRLEELKLSARVAAQRVRETHQPFRFNPMPARERRIIHLELSGAPGVRTESEGAGEHRHLVIYPTDKR
jgi:spoIIIJ-associated protein